MVKHREGGISQPKMLFPRDIVTCTSARVAAIFIHTACGLLRARTIVACSASAAGAVLSPSNRRCTRTDRLAIAKNITFSEPGVVASALLSTCTKPAPLPRCLIITYAPAALPTGVFSAPETASPGSRFPGMHLGLYNGPIGTCSGPVLCVCM